MKDDPEFLAAKCHEMNQRCQQLEAENGVLAYKLFHMRKTVKRLCKDNSFLQTRLREHTAKGPAKPPKKQNGHCNNASLKKDPAKMI